MKRERPTRKDLVLSMLREALRGKVRIEGHTYPCENGWISGWLLAHPAIGGSEGLRRLRELRADGWEIDMRPHPLQHYDTREYKLMPSDRPRPATLFGGS